MEPLRTIAFDLVRELALSLPGVEESTTRGVPSLKVRGKLLACPAVHSSAEPDTIAVKVAVEQRARLIANLPHIYYVTDHYVSHPIVLVRLSRIDRNSLMELLGMAWSFMNSHNSTSRRRVR